MSSGNEAGFTEEARTRASLPVFLVDALSTKDRSVLDGEEARHAVTVRRLRVGERLLLSDGAGGMARGVVEVVRPGRDAELEVAIEERWQEPQPRLRVVLVQALAKGERGELAVELATEAGIDEIIPWRAARSVAVWDEGPRGVKALTRWRNSVRAAAKQARRAWIPAVSEPVNTAALAARIATASAAVVLEASALQRLTQVGLPEDGELLLIVGPEGGITTEELESLREAGATLIRLGPTVLRTSTAGAVALGALGAVTSRWE